MMDRAGAPLLSRVIERLKRTQKVDEIVLATTELPSDDVLADLAKESGISAFRGSENNLLDRFYQAANEYRADVVVRFPGDNATPEPSEIDRIIDYHFRGGSDFSTNIVPAFENGYPMGIGAEVLSKATLEETWRQTSAPEKLEHLALIFFDYFKQAEVQPGKYKVGTIQCPSAFSRPDLVLHVDSQEDYDYMHSLYDYLYPRNKDFHITDIIDWHDNVYERTAGES
jgi:spore coat polysaccharide biosynthesis protein SpsF